jgi:hypothetical protein
VSAQRDKSDLITTTADGRTYLGMPAELAAVVARIIHDRLDLIEKRTGVKVHPDDVPLLAWVSQLDIEVRIAARLASEPVSGDAAPVPPLSVHDVARRSGYTEDGIRKARRRGSLRGEQVGRDWRFWPDDVEQWLGKSRRKSA